MEHVAYSPEVLFCRECMSVLTRDLVARTVECPMVRCSMKGVKFKMPVIRLEPVVEEVNQVAMTQAPPSPNRFAAFNPDEREIIRCLLQEHGNTVSQCAIALDVRVSAYLLAIEELEAEVNAA